MAGVSEQPPKKHVIFELVTSHMFGPDALKLGAHASHSLMPQWEVGDETR
jgi:hypothetical protein